MNVSQLFSGLRTVLNAVQLLGSDQDVGSTSLVEALFLDAEQPGQMNPHGIYILEVLRVVPAERQGRAGLIAAEVSVLLISRCRPVIETGPTDVQAAWDLAEGVAQALERDVADASVAITGINYLGPSADSGTCAHQITATAVYPGG